jgi:hypothetical protein
VGQYTACPTHTLWHLPDAGEEDLIVLVYGMKIIHSLPRVGTIVDHCLDSAAEYYVDD